MSPSIPAANDTDAEDVAWGLQTADTLWKRGERVDAVVWLRRAAQAAMDADAPARAVELGRVAADLSDWLVAQGDDCEEPEQTERIAVPIRPPSRRPPPEAGAEAPPPVIDAAPAASDEEPPPPTTPSVPPGEQVHAGMFNPWGDRPSERGSVLSPEPKAEAPAAPPPPPAPPPPAASRPPSGSMPSAPAGPASPSAAPARTPSIGAMVASGSTEDDSDEVLTSAQPSTSGIAAVPAAPLAPRIDVGAAPAGAPEPAVSRKPPPLPPRARKMPIPEPRPSDVDVETSAPRIAVVPEAPVSDSVPVVMDDLLESDVPMASEEARAAMPPPEALQVAPAPAVEPPPPPAPEPARPQLDLENVESFADLPDDAREAFAAAAKLDRLAESDEVSHFALAYLVEGEVDVAATVVDAPAMRLVKGAVLRSRGTTNEAVPMRLVATNEGALVATWSDGAVEKAFKSCPWVEEDLRTAADRMLTLVGITIGPLGERLDASIREAIVGRLTMRTLSPGEVVVNAGETVPGLLLVGIGELELAKPSGENAIVASGEFLFPTEVLGAGSAPYTARAGAGGALVMFGDRHVAQELLVTCPPLLEVFAGM